MSMKGPMTKMSIEKKSRKKKVNNTRRKKIVILKYTDRPRGKQQTLLCISYPFFVY